MKKIATLLGAAIMWLSAAAQTPFAAIDAYVDSLYSSGKFMGGVAFAKADRVYAKTVGFEDMARGLAADTASLYRIGSISKTFTAVIVMQAVEQGLLSLDDKLSGFFPQIPGSDKITVDMLLRHRSGLNDFPNSGKAPRGWASTPKTRQLIINQITASGLDFEPGTKNSYSNPGYMLLGFIVEDIYGKSYGELVAEKIAAPLGLTHTRVAGNGEGECLSYRPSPGGWVAAGSTDMSAPGGAGGLVSTPSDVARFACGLFGGRLVSAESLAQMQDFSTGNGIGMFRMPFRNEPGRGHNGKIDAFSTAFTYFPGPGIAVAVFANGLDGVKLNDVMIGVLSR